MFTVIEERVKRGVVSIRVLTVQNDVVWATGSKRGLAEIRLELKRITAAVGGTWIKEVK